MNYDVIEIHKNEIILGDTILIDNELKTVCRNNIKYDNFMGITIFGNSYNLGYKLVKKVIIKKICKS